MHPLHRYAAGSTPRPSRIISQAPPLSPMPISTQADPSRYDDALYGQLDPGAQDLQHDPAYPDDPYAYQDDYDEDAEEPAPKRVAAA